MTGKKPSSRAARTIAAAPEAIWAAFMDPAALVDWLPPAGMTGTMHAFDARVGGGYEMSLYYADAEGAPGKTTAGEDRVSVRFIALDPPRRILEAVAFASPDAAFHGEMKIEVTLTETPAGTEVVFHSTDLPPGLRPEDNDEGARSSLEQLARRFEGSPRR